MVGCLARQGSSGVCAGDAAAVGISHTKGSFAPRSCRGAWRGRTGDARSQARSLARPTGLLIWHSRAYRSYLPRCQLLSLWVIGGGAVAAIAADNPRAWVVSVIQNRLATPGDLAPA